jgi:hypothetical protein
LFSWVFLIFVLLESPSQSSNCFLLFCFSILFFFFTYFKMFHNPFLIVRLVFFQYLYYKNNSQNNSIPDHIDVFRDEIQILENAFNTFIWSFQVFEWINIFCRIVLIGLSQWWFIFVNDGISLFVLWVQLFFRKKSDTYISIDLMLQVILGSF